MYTKLPSIWYYTNDFGQKDKDFIIDTTVIEPLWCNTSYMRA